MHFYKTLLNRLSYRINKMGIVPKQLPKEAKTRENEVSRDIWKNKLQAVSS